MSLKNSTIAGHRRAPVGLPLGRREAILYRALRNGRDSARVIPSRLAHLVSMNETAQIAHTFLRQHELAELLQLPERTLEDWRLTHAGPPYMKLGRHVRYDIEDVLAWAKEKRHG